MTVLVTGATGRLGANVVSRIAMHGMEVRALVRPGAERVRKIDQIPSVQVVEGDLHCQESLDRACEGVSHVVHLAAQMVVGTRPVDEFYDINTLGTLRLLESFIRNGLNIERFILASTDSVYRPGDPPGVPLREDMELVPADYYGTSKLLSETIVKNRARQFEVPFVILRFGTILSPEESGTVYRLSFLRDWLRTQQNLGKASTLWPLFVGRPDLADVVERAAGQAPEDSALAIVGPDGPWTLSVVDVRDAVQAVWRSIEESSAAGGTFNIAGSRPTSSLEGSSIVSEVFGVPRIVAELPFTWRMELSIDLAKRRLGFSPTYEYRDTVLAGASESGVQTGSDWYIPAQDDQGVFAQLSGRA